MPEHRPVIMLIDDDEVSLAMGREMLEHKYTLYPVPSGGLAFELLEKVSPDLILLDIEMPDMDGYEVIKHLKQTEKTREIPVIFLTSRTDPGNELEGLNLGAIDYITKPFSPILLVQRIENHLLINFQKKELAYYNKTLQNLVDEQTKEIKNLQNAILSTVSEIVEFRDGTSGGHIKRILMYLQAMIDEMLKQGLYKDEVESWDRDAFINAAQMHDVGKIFVAEEILNKPGKINIEEYNEIKKHTAYGLIIIDRIRQVTNNHTFLDYAKVFTESHHEKWDGTGYPGGRKGQDIPLAGRLMAIADVYDALVSDRPFKQPVNPDDAAKEIFQGSGTLFDPNLVAIFKNITEEFAVISRHRSSIDL